MSDPKTETPPVVPPSRPTLCSAFQIAPHLRGVHFQPCCVDHRRYWEEAKDGLTASDHAPDCEHYKTEKFIRIVPKGARGPALIVETQAEADDTMDGCPEEFDVSEVEMTRDQFSRLGEFNGF